MDFGGGRKGGATMWLKLEWIGECTNLQFKACHTILMVVQIKKCDSCDISTNECIYTHSLKLVLNF